MMFNRQKDPEAGMDTLVKKGQFREMWDRLKKNRRGMVSLFVVLLILLLALIAPLLFDYQSYVVEQHPAQRFSGPSSAHWFGTDQVGRDIFARLIWGARIAVQIGFGTTLCSLAISIVIGCSAAFFGGMVDVVIMRIMDVLQTIPSLIMAMAICAGLGNGMWQLMVAIGVGQIPMFVRMIRAKGLSVANMEFIEAGRALGATNLWLIFRYLLPNIVSIVIVQGTMCISSAVMTGATLSFIGLGVKAPTPEWGAMLQSAMESIQVHPYLLIAPGLALVITSLSINTLGDCLRDAFDPQLKGKA